MSDPDTSLLRLTIAIVLVSMVVYATALYCARPSGGHAEAPHLLPCPPSPPVMVGPMRSFP